MIMEIFRVVTVGPLLGFLVSNLLMIDVKEF